MASEPVKLRTKRRTNMKNRFVKITLILSMLLVMAVPAQVFAADQSCSLNQKALSNANISKIYGQISQNTLDKVMTTFNQYSGNKVGGEQLQNLLNQCNNNSYANVFARIFPGKSNTVKTPEKTKTDGQDQPSKDASPTTPTTPVTPAEPTTPNKTPDATPDTNTNTNTNTNNDNDTQTSNLGSYEQQVVDLVNKERAAAGLPALKVNTKLAAVAEKKAEDMRDKNYFSHTSPTYGSPFDMMKQFGITYTSAGENIAMGQKTPEAVMNGWMNSEGHRANILNSSYTEIGVGYVTSSNGTTYWVQQFIRP
jgi:uncharacterized YkwD family protein